MVHVINGTAADESQCAVELAFGLRQDGDQARWGHDIVRPRRQIQQRAVDVEKKTPGAPPNGAAFSTAAPATGGALN